MGGAAACNCNAGCDITDLECRVHPSDLAEIDGDVLRNAGLEPRCLDCDGILPGENSREPVIACFVGHLASLVVRTLVREGDFRLRDHSSRGIANGSEDTAFGRLCL